MKRPDDDITGRLFVVPHPEKAGHGMIVDEATRLILSTGPMPPPMDLLLKCMFVLNNGGFEEAALQEGAEFYRAPLPENPEEDPRCKAWNVNMSPTEDGDVKVEITSASIRKRGQGPQNN